ncbi:Epoxyqueuosine reductase [compost metagenome]
MRWLRNIAVALGNAWRDTGEHALQQALLGRSEHPDALVREHVQWALAQRSDARAQQ